MTHIYTQPPNADFPCKLIEARPSEDCGCPEEEWVMDTMVVTIHLEDDGEGHIEVDAGDWQRDWFASHSGMADLRQQAADYISTLPRDKTPPHYHQPAVTPPAGHASEGTGNTNPHAPDNGKGGDA